MIIKKFNENFNNIYFFYCFLDTRKPGNYTYNGITFDYEPIYVGKGKGNRPQRHMMLYKNYNTRFYSKLQSIIDSGNEPQFIVLNNNLSEEESFLQEVYFIALIGRKENGGPLTNLSDGGEGQSGYKFSDEVKSKMSIDRSGEGNGMFGKKHSDETKMKISLSKQGVESFKKGKSLIEIYGKEKADEITQKQKISIMNSDRTGDNNGMFGKKHSDDSIQKMKNNRIKLFGEDNPSYGRERKESEKTVDEWELTNIDGRIEVVSNLNKFCRENGLNASNMRNISYGIRKSHRGWIKVVKLTDNVKKKKPSE